MKTIYKAIAVLAIAAALAGLTLSTHAQTPPMLATSKVSVAAVQGDSIPSIEQAAGQPQQTTSGKILLAQTLPTPLPTPTKWTINGNSFVGELNITSVDSQGNLTGTVYGQPITGFWDGVSNKITFIRVPANPSASSQYQIYTGFMFRNNATDPTYTLTGYFEAFSGTGATARRVLYGWFAQVRVPG